MNYFRSEMANQAVQSNLNQDSVTVVPVSPLMSLETRCCVLLSYHMRKVFTWLLWCEMGGGKREPGTDI